MLAEEFILNTGALAAFVVSLAIVLTSYAATGSSRFRRYISAPKTFYTMLHWLLRVWVIVGVFYVIEFAFAVILNRTLFQGATIAARPLVPYLFVFGLSFLGVLYARHHFRRHYARVISKVQLVSPNKAGFRGLSTNDVEVLRTVRNERGDLIRVVFETGWLAEQDVIGSLQRLVSLGLVKVQDDRAYLTTEGSDVLVYPLSLFSAGADRKTLDELAGAREALKRGDGLHAISACSRTLERLLREKVVLAKLSEKEAAERFGKPLERTTLGDLIGYVRDKEKDHFLGGILTTINESRKTLHETNTNVVEDAAATYLLTELAVRYMYNRGTD